MGTTTEDRVVALRQNLPVVERQVYLNTGTAGPLPRQTAIAIAAANEQQLLDGRASFKVYLEEYCQVNSSAKERIASSSYIMAA